MLPRVPLTTLIPLGKLKPESMEVARILVLVGLAIAAVGAILWAVTAAFPNFRLGRLPGDINIQGDNYRVMIPIGTMILASIILTLLVWIYTAFRR